MVAAVLAASGVALILFATLVHIVTDPYDYGLMVDAGSSGCRIHVYSWYGGMLLVLLLLLLLLLRSPCPQQCMGWMERWLWLLLLVVLAQAAWQQ